MAKRPMKKQTIAVKSEQHRIAPGDRLEGLGLFVSSMHEKTTAFTFIDDTGAASHLSVADVIRRIHVDR